MTETTFGCKPFYSSWRKVNQFRCLLEKEVVGSDYSIEGYLSKGDESFFVFFTAPMGAALL